MLSGRGNVVSREEDRGDFWEPYKGLDGGSRVAMTNKQNVPKRGNRGLSATKAKASREPSCSGPVVSEFRVARPFGSGKFATTIRLYQGLRRIEVTTRLVNQEKFVRYQVHFPTTIKDGKTTHEIPFGSIDRPSAIEFPAQNWVDFGDGRHGLAVLNIGLPGNLVDRRNHAGLAASRPQLGAYGFGGGYEPGMSSETGFQLGQERTMQLRPGPPCRRLARRGRLPRRLGIQSSADLPQRSPARRPAAQRAGVWSKSRTPHVVVSSLKPTRTAKSPCGSTRRPAGAATGVTIKLNARILAAREANLMEDAGS